MFIFILQSFRLQLVTQCAQVCHIGRLARPLDTKSKALRWFRNDMKMNMVNFLSLNIRITKPSANKESKVTWCAERPLFCKMLYSLTPNFEANNFVTE